MATGRIVVRKEHLCQTLANDDPPRKIRVHADGRRTKLIPLGEAPAAQKRKSESTEIIFGDDPETHQRCRLGRRHIPRISRRNPNAHADGHRSIDRPRVHRRRCEHAGNAAYAQEKLIDEITAVAPAFVRRRQRDREEHPVLRLEPSVDLKQGSEAARQENGADEENERQRDLGTTSALRMKRSVLPATKCRSPPRSTLIRLP